MGRVAKAALIGGLVLLVAVAWPAAEETLTMEGLYEFSARVKVEVGGDEMVVPQTQSWIAAELRKIEGVEVVGEDPEWTIWIVVQRAHSKGGYETGVAMSILVVQEFWNGLVVHLVPEENKAWANDLTSDLCRQLSLEVETGGPEDLRGICDRIVAQFDTEVLEDIRQERARLRREHEERKALTAEEGSDG